MKQVLQQAKANHRIESLTITACPALHDTLVELDIPNILDMEN
jgi:hypothetical protein